MNSNSNRVTKFNNDNCLSFIIQNTNMSIEKKSKKNINLETGSLNLKGSYKLDSIVFLYIYFDKSIRFPVFYHQFTSDRVIESNAFFFWFRKSENILVTDIRIVILFIGGKVREIFTRKSKITHILLHS